MEKIQLQIYDLDFKTVRRVVSAEMPVIPFGAIRKLMKLFDVENISDISQILNITLKSWDSVVGILDRIFPGVTEDEWDYVDTRELVGAVCKLMKYAAGELVKIPADPKN